MTPPSEKDLSREAVSSAEVENNVPEATAASRRRFLQGAGALGSAIVLGLMAENAEAQAQAPAAAEGATSEAPQLVLKLNDNPELGKVGGWKIVDLGAERVIIANTDEGIVACSAICPHKGCEVEYREADKQFFCPCHNSRFDLTGKVLRGPSRTGLARYDAQTALVVSAKKPE